MIRMPSIKQLESADLGKLKSKSNNRYIFADKIVNRKVEPTLFNLQAAATQMQLTQGDISMRAGRRRGNVETDMLTLSRQTMLQMNVVVDPAPRDFSILGCNKIINLDENPNIVDGQQIDQLEPLEVQIDKYFPSEDDPILQLDDGDQSAKKEKQPTIQGNVMIATIDLSRIVSGIQILNESKIYYGKNKYYKQQGQANWPKQEK